MTDIIRVGLLGYGYASKTFHAPLIAATSGMKLAAVSSSDAGKVQADWPSMRVVREPQELFNDSDIDLIVIPTRMTPISRWRVRRWLPASMWWSINPSP
ncbi:putative oxidoreductase YdgJ [Dickeya solani]|nr:putative oxidoreductase YdgJ [Dickeya solani]